LVTVVVETKYKFIGTDVAELFPDDRLDQRRIVLEAIEVFALLLELGLRLGQSPPIGIFLRAVDSEFLVQLEKKHAGKHRDSDEERQKNTGGELGPVEVLQADRLMPRRREQASFLNSF
jgi:hypothetical protein